MTRFMEKVLLAPGIANAHKKMIPLSERIVGDVVADYYYRISDQEIWSYASDFPNCTPPFSQFFIEFRAPTHIVSRVHGVHPWPSAGVQEWGVQCTGTDVAQRLEATTHPQGRKRLGTENLRELVHLWNTARSFLPETARIETLETDAAASTLLGNRALIVDHVIQRLELARLMQTEQWNRVREILERQEHRWTLDLLLFVNVPSGGKEHIWGPIWHLRLYVKHDGRVVLTPDGEALLMEEPLNEMALRLDMKHRSGEGDYLDIFGEAHRELSPFLHTAMLTVSFLHCRNVKLEEVSPSRKPLSNKQRRRGDPLPPRLTYQILDILPMRQILRTVGSEKQNGTKLALHICRGYFADYQEGKGLFGKYHGIYWFDQKVRGSGKRGIALKDYQVHQPPAHQNSPPEGVQLP